MALFQRKIHHTSSVPSYSIGASKNKLVIGLGNPGKPYQKTRHNLGYQALDYFAAHNEFPGWVVKKDLACELNSRTIGDVRVILCKPSKYMNNSGQAAAATQRFFRIYNRDTLVVYDELALPLGQLRTRLGGTDAGHNGVGSLIEHIGDDFGRLRVGIGSQTAKMADASAFVLGDFNKEEQSLLEPILRECNSLINEFIVGGQLAAQTRDLNP